MLAQAVRLDKLYIGTRYPDALPEGTEIADAYQKAPQCSACNRAAVQGVVTGHAAGNERR